MSDDKSQTTATRSALRQALDHIFGDDGETERRIAIALCELDGNNPDALAQGKSDPLLRRFWELYLPRAKEALNGK